MSLALRTSLGCTEAIIADDGNLQLFYQVASLLEDQFSISFYKKEDEFDSINWDFRFQGHQLSLHYDIYSGVSVLPSREHRAVYKENKAVIELGALIEEQLQHLPALRHSA
ncbi:MAG: hypothetical protein ACK4E0_01945 [Chitinophagaceae bacterium]|jgi:hypothetical protein